MPTPHSDHRDGPAQPREAYAALHDVLMRINDHPVTRLHQPVSAEALEACLMRTPPMQERTLLVPKVG